MKRPFINVEQNNLLIYFGVGSGWIITSILGLLEQYSQTFYYLHLAGIFVMLILLIYIVVGKHETNDEMSIAHRNEAHTFGFTVVSFMILFIIPFDRYLIDGGVLFSFAGYFLLGIGFLSIGWKFRQLERNGD